MNDASVNKALMIENLTVTRGKFTLENVSFDVNETEIFAILGRTGSGKTVLLEAIAGAFPLKSGIVRLFGQDASTLTIQDRNIGFTYQDCGLFPHLNVYDNIAYGLKMHHIPKKITAQKVETMMELLGISYIASRYPATISGGERQRTSLARALVLEPRLLLLDEPFCSLDPTTKKSLYAEVERIHETFGCTILFVTHDFTEAQLLADRIGIMLDGRLRCVVDADQLLNHTYESDIECFLGRGTPRVMTRPLRTSKCELLEEVT